MDTGSEAMREAGDWVERLGRVGYASKGVVYSIIGFLALGAAFGRNQVSDSDGAFLAILRQPFGTFLLCLVGAGLMGYAIWRLVEAAVDPEGKGNDFKGIAYRTWLVGRGLVHAWIAVEAFRLAAGGARGGGDEAEHWTRRLIDEPFGVWLIAAAGAGIALYGAGQIVQAWRADFGKRMSFSGVDSGTRRWLVRVSRYGLAARGLVFMIVGVFLIRAARQEDPSEAGGIAEALGSLRDNSYGPWLLAVVAVGLISYGIYELLKARYRRIARLGSS